MSSCARSAAFNGANRNASSPRWASTCRSFRPTNTSPAGPNRAPATTSPPAAVARQDRNGSHWLDWAIEQSAMAAICAKDVYLAANTPASEPAASTRKRSTPSNTQSPSPAGTCSPPASCTPTSAATTSADATPNESPNASSPQLEALAHHPWWPRRPERHFTSERGPAHTGTRRNGKFAAEGNSVARSKSRHSDPRVSSGPPRSMAPVEPGITITPLVARLNASHQERPSRSRASATL